MIRSQQLQDALQSGKDVPNNKGSKIVNADKGGRDAQLQVNSLTGAYRFYDPFNDYSVGVNVNGDGSFGSSLKVGEDYGENKEWKDVLEGGAAGEPMN